MSHEEERKDTERGYFTYRTTPKEKKKRTGMLVVLIVLALVTGFVSWAINVMDLKVAFGENNMTLSVGKQEEGKPLLPPVKKNANRTDPKSDGQGLVIEQTPYGVENYRSDHEEALSLQQIYEKAAPGVVSVRCVSRGDTVEGTGIIMSSDGYVITNYAVVEHAKQIHVITEDGQSHEAALSGMDELTDLAVLKIETQEPLQPAEFGDSEMLRVGDAVVSISDPTGAMTDGIVSAIDRDLNLSGRQMTLIRTNALPGAGCGGPLINCFGQVIAINAMRIDTDDVIVPVEGLGFAIPVVQVKPIVDELVMQGYVSGRASIGIRGETAEPDVQIFYQLPPGVIVTAIEEGSKAYDAGLQINDVIVQYDEIPIASLNDLVAAKQASRIGDAVALTVYRGGDYHTIILDLVSQVEANIY